MNVNTEKISVWVTWKISCESADLVVETAGCPPKFVLFSTIIKLCLGIQLLISGLFLTPLQLDMVYG